MCSCSKILTVCVIVFMQFVSNQWKMRCPIIIFSVSSISWKKYLRTTDMTKAASAEQWLACCQSWRSGQGCRGEYENSEVWKRKQWDFSFSLVKMLKKESITLLEVKSHRARGESWEHKQQRGQWHGLGCSCNLFSHYTFPYSGNRTCHWKGHQSAGSYSPRRYHNRRNLSHSWGCRPKE